MLFESALITAASGSLGGITASRNRGGSYFRARVIPVDPASPAQLEAREAMKNSVAAWALLSQADQDSWSSYGQRIKRVGPLGGSVQLSGQQMYLRSKLSALRVNEFASSVVLSVPDSAPAGSTLPAFIVSPLPDLAEEIDQTIFVTFDDTEPWVTEDGAAMLFFQGLPQGSGINFFRGPFQLAAFVLGNSVSPPSSPIQLGIAFPFTAADKIWTKFRLFRLDGGLSAELIEGPLLATA